MHVRFQFLSHILMTFLISLNSNFVRIPSAGTDNPIDSVKAYWSKLQSSGNYISLVQTEMYNYSAYIYKGNDSYGAVFVTGYNRSTQAIYYQLHNATWYDTSFAAQATVNEINNRIRYDISSGVTSYTFMVDFTKFNNYIIYGGDSSACLLAMVFVETGAAYMKILYDNTNRNIELTYNLNSNTITITFDRAWWGGLGIIG